MSLAGRRAGPRFEAGEVTGAGWTAKVGLRLGPAGADARRPLLLFNGFGTPMASLAPFVRALGDWPLIVVDAPGVGTRSPQLPYLLAGLVHQVERWLDQHLSAHGPIDVMGVSWGGCVAQQFAFQCPQRCARLVLAATSPGAFMVPGRPDALLGLTRELLDRAPPPSPGPGEAAPDWARPPARGAGLFAGLFQLWALATWTSLPWLALLRQRTLILAGSRDALVPAANASLLRALIPDASLALLPSGHAFLVDRADEVAAKVRSFLGEDPVVAGA